MIPQMCRGITRRPIGAIRFRRYMIIQIQVKLKEGPITSLLNQRYAAVTPARTSLRTRREPRSQRVAPVASGSQRFSKVFSISVRLPGQFLVQHVEKFSKFHLRPAVIKSRNWFLTGSQLILFILILFAIGSHLSQGVRKGFFSVVLVRGWNSQPKKKLVKYFIYVLN